MAHMGAWPLGAYTFKLEQYHNGWVIKMKVFHFRRTLILKTNFLVKTFEDIHHPISWSWELCNFHLFNPVKHQLFLELVFGLSDWVIGQTYIDVFLN